MEIAQPDVWVERMKVIRRVKDENVVCEDEVKLIVKGESRFYHRIFRPITVHGKSDEVIVFATEITHSIPRA
jgi:hypothetical protein